MANKANSAVHMLLVSREPAAHTCLWTLSQTNAWKLDAASSGLHALELARSGATLNLVLLDLETGDADGLRTLRWLRRVRPEIPVVLLCPRENKEQMAEAARLGVHDYAIKPCHTQQLEKVLKRHLNGKAQGEELKPTGEEIEPLGDEMFFVAGSPVMHTLRARAELLAQINVPVLILGESGSGKEIVGRLIHRLSVRSSNQFLKVNCGALPRELLESELFGFERRGSNGTPRTGQGKFELCDRGTILLNEITEMPSGLQSQLLHILQDGRFFRVDGKATIPLDIRVLAATNMDLERALFEKKLREDLYYRLSAFTVHVPPLRQRKEEIPLLLGHFMNRMSKHYELPARLFSANVLEACQQYSWPGNLRELENFVKRYLVMGDDSLGLSELEPGSNLFGQHSMASESDSVHRPVESATSLKSLVRSAKGETERNAISGALQQTHWNRKAAARLLRISYRALLYKIQQYQMSPPQGYVSQFAIGHGVKGNGQAS